VNVIVCIPTLNASGTWDAFATALKSQTVKPTEVIVIDSTSDDNTAELAGRSGFRVVQIPRKEFRHGATRQHAAELAAEADVLVYLTQDATLADPNALALLLQAFENPQVGAAFGRQLPREGANPIEAHARLFNYPPVSSLRSIDSVPTLGSKSIFFSNSFGAYRRTALEAVGGFPREVNFGEDTVVAAHLLNLGWKVAYVAEAKVLHSHRYSCVEEMKRYVAVGELHRTESWLLTHFGGTSSTGFGFVASEIRLLAKQAPALIPEAVIRTGLKYIGYKVGRHNATAQVRNWLGMTCEEDRAPRQLLDRVAQPDA
jgi:rhamnosyltransferase